MKLISIKKMLSATLLLSVSPFGMASGINTVCEYLGGERFVCDTFPTAPNTSLLSQTWTVMSGAHPLERGTGYLLVDCASTHEDGRYRFHAVLSDGSEFSQTGSIPCSFGGGSGTTGPSTDCTTAHTGPQCQHAQ